MKSLSLVISCLLLILSPLCFADVIVPIHLTANDQAIGVVTIKETRRGLIFVPNLRDLPPGEHGFHIHEHPDCAEHGNAAGGHLDPFRTGKHLGPNNPNGHLGDLPVLHVSTRGRATHPVYAPRLKLSDVLGHSLMIHEGGDNYSDYPKKLGGGGNRIACGAIPTHK